MSSETADKIRQKAEENRQKHLAEGAYSVEDESRVAEVELKLPGSDLPPLTRLEEAQFRLSQTYAPSSMPGFTSHRPGVGKLIVAAKKLVHRLARPFLGVILANQVEFNRNLVDFSHEVLANLDRLEEKSGEDLRQTLELLRQAEPQPGGFNLSEIERSLFERISRGSDQEVQARLTGYVELFRGAPGPVLALGGDRVGFQKLLQAAGIEALGSDPPERVNNILGDYPDNTLGGIFLGQAIELLDLNRLVSLLESASRALVPGGLILAESISGPVSPPKGFSRGSLRNRPLHPEAARFILESSGFSRVEVMPLNHSPEEARLQPINRFLPGAKRANQNIAKLNGLLFGARDYAVIGRK